MATIVIRCGHGLPFYIREYPSFPFELNGLRFTSDLNERADWLVQSSAESEPVKTVIPLARRILVMSEPSGYFPAKYVNQFGILVSPFNVEGFVGAWYPSHGALASFFGMEFTGQSWQQAMSYQELMGLPIPTKSDTIAVVLSRKSILPGHRRRLRFVDRLRDVLGLRLAIYGRGFRHIGDKAEAILPRKYHLVIENTVMPSYWTEKVADAWLGHALPIVSGPPNLASWFPKDSFVMIDCDDSDRAIATIVDALAADEYTRRMAPISEARLRLMQNERLCHLATRVIAANPSAALPLTVPDNIRPPGRVSAARRIEREVARAFWKIQMRVTPR